MNRNSVSRASVPVLLILITIFFSSSCSREKSVTIAEQYGLAYAPLQIMRAQGYFEQSAPELEINWIKLGNTAAIREAVVAGEVDLGFMGLPPFLIGADHGMDWKLIAGLSICPVGLVAGDAIAEGRDSSGLDAVNPSHRIALPQPGSIQHILLSMAAEREYGDAARFDDSLVTMKHPDGMTALLSGAVDAHFTSPPYIFLENDAEAVDGSGFQTVLSGFDAFGGEFTFIGAMAAGGFIEDDAELLEAFLQAIEQSVDFINNSPEEAAGLLSASYDMPAGQILSYISREDMKYTTEIFGLERFIEFMNEQGYLSGEITSADVTLRGYRAQ
ncbi:MAG TPA: ABC transporter substrate-binding protein [Spirochaeta sp.]|nr:ABC transporter substrate-binding protein [Spirochaeta sp.]